MCKLFQVKEARISAWAVIWIVLILFVFEFFIRSGIPWSNEKLEPCLLRGGSDDWIHNAFIIEKIERLSKNTDTLLMVFIGGSASLEAVISDSYVTSRLRESTGRNVEFLSICSSYLTQSDMVKISRTLGHVNGSVFIGTEPLAFKPEYSIQLDRHSGKNSKGYNSNKYFYLSAGNKLARILKDYGYGLPLIHRFCTVRSLKGFGQIIVYSYNRFVNYRRFHEKYFRHSPEGDPVTYTKKFAAIIDRQYERYTENVKLNADLYQLFLDNLLNKQNRVAIIDLPIVPVYENEMKRFYDHYDPLIRGIVRNKNIGYIDLRHAAEWTADDFRDLHHMRNTGKKKFSDALAAELIPIVKNYRR